MRERLRLASLHLRRAGRALLRGPAKKNSGVRRSKPVSHNSSGPALSLLLEEKKQRLDKLAECLDMPTSEADEFCISVMVDIAKRRLSPDLLPLSQEREDLLRACCRRSLATGSPIDVVMKKILDERGAQGTDGAA
jgi:hypothetical protein